MQLIKPTKEYEESWIEALAEFQEETVNGFWNLPERPKDLDRYILRTESHSKGEGLTGTLVASTTYWLIVHDQFVGHANIRHSLSEHLKQWGGHIGYAIRPSERKKGYGTLILQLALQKAKELGFDAVLVTCDESNAASRKIIERNGGRYENTVIGNNGPKLRFWIDL